MSDRKITSRMRLVEMTDGHTFEVRVTNPDLVRWDQTAPRQKWGTVAEVPFLARSFTTWAACRRLGLFNGDFNAWGEQCADIEDLEPDEADTAHPTSPAAGPGHS